MITATTMATRIAIFTHGVLRSASSRLSSFESAQSSSARGGGATTRQGERTALDGEELTSRGGGELVVVVEIVHARVALALRVSDATATETESAPALAAASAPRQRARLFPARVPRQRMSTTPGNHTDPYAAPTPSARAVARSATPQGLVPSVRCDTC